MKNKTKCSTVSRKADQEYCEDNYHIKVKAMGNNPNSLMSSDSLLMRFTRWLRTKLTLVLILSVSLVSQAQISFCDSLSYTTAPNPILSVTGNSTLSPNMVDSITWLWTACNSSTCYTAYGNPGTFASILTTDTVKLCYDAYVYFMGQPYVCTECDSLVYDGFSYSWVLLNMGNPTAITELQLNTNNDGKMYDLLGREVIEAQIGVMYIRNNKKYIRIN